MKFRNCGILTISCLLAIKSSSSAASIFDSVGSLGKNCAAIWNKAVENSSQAFQNSDFIKRVEEIPTLAGELMSQLGQITCTAGNCGLVALKTLAQSAVAICRSSAWYQSPRKYPGT